MGGLPLLAVVKPIFRGFFREEQPGTVGGILSGAFGATASMVRQVARPSSTATVSTTSAPYSPPRAPGSSAADIAEALERIDALHRSGSLTDEEFEAAKLQVLTED
jgi:hypothetical protein